MMNLNTVELKQAKNGWVAKYNPDDREYVFLTFHDAFVHIAEHYGVMGFASDGVRTLGGAPLGEIKP